MKFYNSILIVIIFIINCFNYAENLDNKKINPQRIFANLNFASIDKIIKYKNKFFVLETLNHRILVYDRSGEKNLQISKIGQGKGEVYYPANFVIREDTIYVLDGNDRGISRIQSFDLKGNFLEEVVINQKSYGFDVNSEHEIYLGQPERGNLISVFRKDGKLIRAFGRLRKISDFYGKEVGNMDNEYKTAINRINICVDKEKNVYISFVGAPFFQKYGDDGNLIYEKKIQGPEAKEIINGFRKNKKSPVRRAIDNIPTPLINTGISIDDIERIIVIAFQWNRAWLYIAKSNGDKITVWEPIDKSMLFQNISISSDSILFLPRQSVIKFNEAYSVKVNDLTKKNKKGGD